MCPKLQGCKMIRSLGDFDEEVMNHRKDKRETVPTV